MLYDNFIENKKTRQIKRRGGNKQLIRISDTLGMN